MSIPIGWVLQPDEAHLALTAPLLDRVDYLELAPETIWTVDRAGRLHPNGFFARFAAERTRGLPFVAHSTALSMCASPPGDEARREAWLERVARDHETFAFAWWTDHLGATMLPSQKGPRYVALPVPMGASARTRAALEATLDRMQGVVPDVGVENTAFHFAWDAPEHEPWMLRDALAGGARRHLLLDLHNLVLNAETLGYDARQWLATIDLSKVIEIHVAGGSWSDPRWLPSGRSMRLDGHDHDVPEAVWALLAEALPRCTSLRGVTLERMEGTVSTPEDVARLGGELDRLRALVSAPPSDAASRWPVPFARPVTTPAPFDDDGYLDELSHAERVHDDGRRLTALLVAKLRFERIQRGSDLAMRWFDADPEGFSAVFTRYHAGAPMREVFPAPEAEAFFAFCEGEGLLARR
ncbi:MAG: DUF692 domain-containing protein [Sandaracinaceae bacterium]|nr:DUF692 domain-containing protein [Sandaracinaceae bacterium]